jgi:nicotinate-nucleotide adenylyltransferase
VAIGVIGGTFDPIHIAHLIIAEAALEALSLRQVVFVPAARPPHKDVGRLTPIGHRLEMVRLAIAGNARLAVSDIEARRESPSYTIDTIREFRSGLGATEEIYFIMGGDSLVEFFTWKDPLELLGACRFAVVPRPGVSLDEADPRILDRASIIAAPEMSIASRDIRERARHGRTIRYLVPATVESYIHEKKLYT